MKAIKLFYLITMFVKLKLNGVRFDWSVRGNRPFIKNKGAIHIGKSVSLNSYPGGEILVTGLQTHLHESFIEIGDFCNLNGTMIHCRSAVKIGSYCMFGPGTKIIDNDSHRLSIDLQERRKSPESNPINIADNVWIGMGSLILKGVTIGENSVVAAHSVVTKDIPPNTLVGGNPAKIIRNLIS